MGRPQAWASSMAARSAPSRAAWGVCAAATSSRSTGATTRSPRMRLRESTTGTTGMTAASVVVAAATIVSTSSVRRAGRAASCTSTSVSSSWPAPVSAHTPAITESARTSPPGTTRQRRASRGSASVKRSTAPAVTAMATRSRPSTASSVSRLHRHVGRPHRSSHSLSLPIRLLRPAATRMAVKLTSAGLAARLREDHPSGHGLEHARHADRHLLVEEAESALHHDHRPVIEVADTLAGFLPLLDDADAHLLARMYDRLHGVRQLVDVQHANPLE